MSTFDPDLFLQTQSDQANSTVLNPVPEGEWVGVVKDLKPRSLSDGRAVLDVVWSIDDATVKTETGMAEPTVRQSVWLDLTESGGLDFSKGKNVSLGRLREALGQNQPNKPWAPSMLLGQVGKVKVVHSTDKNDSSIIYANVNAVTKV